MKMYNYLKYFVFIISFNCVKINNGQQLYLLEGANCPLSNNTETGICKVLSDCSIAMSELKENNIRPVICSFRKLIPIVCCKFISNFTESTTESITTQDPNNDFSSGDNCTLPNGKLGTCEKTEECNINISYDNNEFDVKKCSSSKFDDLICCMKKKTKNYYGCEMYKRLASTQNQLIFNENIAFDSNDPLPEIFDEDNSTDNVFKIYEPVTQPIEYNEVGGVEAKEFEFPHMGLIGFGTENDTKWRCGGTLINERYVLTAAHCLYVQDLGEAKFVRLGELNLLEKLLNDYPSKDYKIIQSIQHPDFKPPLMYNDIALLKLNETVFFSRNIFPACIYENPKINKSKLDATGWGATEFEGEMSNHLMKVDLNIYTHEECYPFYNQTLFKRFLPQGIDEEMHLCVGGKTEEKDSCQGDSGGPVQFKEFYIFYVVGVTSFGKACGLASTPGIYTRVSTYSSWIASIVWE